MMDWSSLLCRKRLRKILDDKESTSEEDQRTEFEKDYDRVIYSTPFRRLQDKAQVFPLESHDAVHTRLAHSMEVARVAKGLAQKVFEDVIKENEDFGNEEKSESEEKKKRDIATIAEVCGLVHDFGNPPFGHAGEEAMRDWFRSKLLKEKAKEKFESGQNLDLENDLSETGESFRKDSQQYPFGSQQYLYDFLRFDGNAHTIRLLSRLQVVAHYRGLNLTAGTMAAALKYLPPSHEVDERNHLYSKPGYLASEEAVVKKVRDVTGMGKNRNPITVLVEAADDIVNSLIDLEDAVRKGELSWEEIKERMKGKDGYGQFDEIRREAEDIVEDGDAALNGDEGEACLRMFRTKAIKEHVDAVSDRFEEKYSEIMDGDYPCEILGDEDTATSELAEACDNLKFDRVIPSRDVIKLEYMGRNVMQDLMDMFWEGAQEAPELESDFNEKIYNLSSQNYRSVFERTGKRGLEKHENDSLKPKIRDVESIYPLDRSQYCPEETGYSLPIQYQRLQLVADQVCGMTDSYACQLHRDLTNR